MHSQSRRTLMGILLTALAVFVAAGSAMIARAAGSDDTCQPGSLVMTPTVAMNVGGPEVSAGGKTWAADQYGTGGHVWTTTSTADIADTDLDAVYRSERAAKNLAYAIPVENGTYVVRLHLTELYWNAPGGSTPGAKPGKRVETFTIEQGFPQMRGIDPAAAAKGTLKAFTQAREVSVSDATLNIVGYGHTDFAALQGIEAFRLQTCTSKGQPGPAPQPTLSAESAGVGSDGVESDSGTDAAPSANQPPEEPAEQPQAQPEPSAAPTVEQAKPAPAAPADNAGGTSLPLGNGPQRYVDCKGGAGDGSQANPWSSPSQMGRLPAGATVNFARGCSWSGRFEVAGQGSAGNPVTLRAAPGSGAAPTFSAPNPTPGDYNSSILTTTSPYIVVDGLHFTNTPGVAISIRGTNNHVRNTTIDNVGIGMWFYANDSSAYNVKARDLRIVRNTPGGNDDYGAIGFDIEADNITIERSSCINCIDKSYDYDTDGGFVEIWRKGSGLKVLNNYSENTEGFLEAGTDSQAPVSNIVIRGNTIKNPNNVGVYFNQDSPDYKINVSNVLFENNTVTGGQYFPIDDFVVVRNSTYNGQAIKG